MKMKQHEKHSKPSLWFVALVAIAAIVGIVILTLSMKTVRVAEEEVLAEEADLAGKAISACTDECSFVGEGSCDGNFPLACGNYDGDSCLEWKKGSLCQYGCSQGFCLSQPKATTASLDESLITSPRK